MNRIKVIMVMLSAGLFVIQGVSYAQHDHQKAEKINMSTADQQEKMSATMGKPTFEKSVEGVQVQVWLITQDEHRKMMGTMMQDKKDSSTGGGMMHEEMKHDMNKMDRGMMGTMMQGKKDSSTGGHMMHGEMKDKMKEMDHKMMGQGMKDQMKDDENKKTMESMMAGTHHVIVKAVDEKTQKAISDGPVRIVVTGPSGKSSIVGLAEMMNHFGGGLSLDEKGSYTLNVFLNEGKETKKATFSYEVK